MQNKVSNFFTAEDTLKNILGRSQSYTGNKVIMYNVNYTASRMDLIKFSINADMEVINWFMDETVLRDANMFALTPHGKGLAVEFKCTSRVSTKHAYELIKNKILAKNTVEISVHELIYNEITDTIYISFKTNIEMEKNKIGIIKAGTRFHWSYIEKNKLAEITKDNRSVKKFHNTNNKWK
ncbi:MAG: hypothetical protein ACRCX2_17970 [Paraclostridium sp.]